MTLFDSTRTLGASVSGRMGSTLGSPGKTSSRGKKAASPDPDHAGEVTSSFPSVSGRTSEFRFHGVIGSGKFSTVWRATHVPTNATVAVKKVQIYEILDAKQRQDCLTRRAYVCAPEHDLTGLSS